MNNPFWHHFQNLESVNACLARRDELNQSKEFEDLKKQLNQASKDQKQKLGQQLNQLKNLLQTASDRRILELQELHEKDHFLKFDPTIYTSSIFANPAKLHPISQITLEVVRIFENLGFDVADGPLIATQENNFTLLNMPDYHPARAMQDTFYLQEKDQNGQNLVMRTHTTSLDVPYAKSHSAPFKMIAPGKVFRNETIDSTHDILFHQIECLVVDRQVSLAQLKSLIQDFYSKFFGKSDLRVRFRPSYFPYTVPSMEVDISNPFAGVKGHKLENQEWIEAGGSGLMHPDVIRNMGLDPKEWGGLAFGFGIDRMAQLKLEISGITQFFEGGISFLKGSPF